VTPGNHICDLPVEYDELSSIDGVFGGISIVNSQLRGRHNPQGMRFDSVPPSGGGIAPPVLLS
jgi:hypothetical protein